MCIEFNLDKAQAPKSSGSIFAKLMLAAIPLGCAAEEEPQQSFQNSSDYQRWWNTLASDASDASDENVAA